MKNICLENSFFFFKYLGVIFLMGLTYYFTCYYHLNFSIFKTGLSPISNFDAISFSSPFRSPFLLAFTKCIY